MTILVVRRIMPKCNIVTCLHHCTIILWEWGRQVKFSIAFSLKYQVAFSVGMCCVTVCTNTVQWTLEHWHVVEVKVNLSLNFMSAYEGEWSAECPVERIHSTHWIGSWLDPGAGLDSWKMRWLMPDRNKDVILQLSIL